MNPPPHGDPLGMAIVIIGTALTLWVIAFAVRVSISPGEHDPRHPKYLIFKDDR
ncbi:MAG: hypothetical protein GIX03_15350 [Candidatus Eremiobacteraeota bacterium]|nr:hypothetical protein [Candidatus Eremiobacteraeota bacterium]MBC5825053.1 hypothetical protein [Candidatus Eremiobacteraeota bacterium]